MMDERFQSLTSAVDPAAILPPTSLDALALPDDEPRPSARSRLTRTLERKQRLYNTAAPRGLPAWAYEETTRVSFALEGIEVTSEELAEALAPRREGRGIRSRLGQRLRNHVTILRAIDRRARRQIAQDPDALLHWYTSISNGLSMNDLAGVQSTRARMIVRRINSPQFRLQVAIQEIVELHCALLAEPMFPSFNGILARLILRAHLMRCSLPPVMFCTEIDTRETFIPGLFTGRLMQLIEKSFDRLRRDERGPS